MKTCSRCNALKPLTEFHKRSSASDGRMSHCKKCNAAKARKYRRENPDRMRQLDKKYAASKWGAHIARKYGMTHETYNKMLSEQNGRCAICLAEEPGGRAKRFYIDHDHATGEVRGLLCTTCNQMLGYAKDNPDILMSGAEYLRSMPKSPRRSSKRTY